MLIVVCTLVPLLPGRRIAAEPKSDQRALGMIFGDSNLANVLELRRRTAHLTAREKFPLLLQAVLPKGRDVVRIDVDFAPAHMAGVASEQFGQESGTNGKIPGGELLSPAIELVEVARQLDRLDEIRQILRERASAGASDLKSILAMQILVSISAAEYEPAQDGIAELIRLVANAPVQLAERGPEAVVIWTAAGHLQTRDVANDLTFLVYEQARGQVGPRSERWHRQVYAIKYLLEGLIRRQRFEVEEQPTSHWHPVTRTTAETNGQGFPLSHWDRQEGQVVHTTGHDRDYFYYQIPLAGNFSVEADTSTFNYEDIRLAYGGIWAGPGYDLQTVLNGNFRNDHHTLTIAPPLSEIRDPMRVRIDVQDGLRTTLINGREVFSCGVSQSDPWLSIFSYWYTHGWVRNVRITGEAVVPDEIELATGADLPGWLPYYEESAGHGNSDWRLIDSSRLSSTSASPATEAEGILQAKRNSQQSGSLQESLLRYHRPMLEDGVIEYDFFYRENEFDVHPALDRCAFLLEPDGVGLHWVTDGKYERCGLDPGSRLTMPHSQPGDAPVPLREDDWNHVALRLKGDVATIELNGSLVFERQLAEGNRRTFGLFHYADRTEARVRNLRWRGDWPRQLPAVDDQELAHGVVEPLIAGAEWTESFKHDFSQGVSVEKFLIAGEGWEQNFQQLPEGVQFVRPGGDAYLKYSVIPHLVLSGDFDIVAEFSDFEAAIDAGGDANIHLLIGLEDQTTDCRLYRKFSRYSNKEDGEQIIQAAVFRVRNGRTNYAFPEKSPEASTAGRMRLIRRGTRLHYLYAADLSSNYRLVHTEDVPAGNTRPDSLRLIVETNKPGRASVTWKSLQVRAEQMSGLALQPSFSMNELDDQRTRLPQQATFDFSNVQTHPLLRMWGSHASVDVDDAGILLKVPGSDEWLGAGLSPNVALRGDFDATLELEVLKFEPTAKGQESTVYLEAELSDELATQVQTKYSIAQQGLQTAEIQLRRRKPDGNFDYEELASVPFPTAYRLRIARRGKVAYLIFQSQADQPSQLLGRVEIGAQPIATGQLRAIVHTGGAGRESSVRFRLLQVYADQLEVSVPTPIEQNPSP